ncbi:hypothetical protein FNV43_RR16729 [Rhamnella rubrinervis]|uniref:Transmembrane protein n=1 Tax=Rhamnella rubrinervis TaxID=2594499 RepID=A0A8K0GZD1_9ROSA|nr:hypothetical protein FNV43_RR16729 [Rhamnella rubrinervis]
MSAPSPLLGVSTSHGSKNVVLCERVQVSGISRLELGSYASGRTILYLLLNESLGLCQCEKDEWRSLQKGLWSSVMSPYQKKYVDVKFTGEVSGPVTVTLVKFNGYRSSAGHYHSSISGNETIANWQKNFFYLTIYGSLVSVFLLVAIILAGAALGYWIVRKFVISKDGSVDASVAQFVKWAMRITGTTSILQSTLDTPLAVGALVSCWAVHKLITSLKPHRKILVVKVMNGRIGNQLGHFSLCQNQDASFFCDSYMVKPPWSSVLLTMQESIIYSEWESLDAAGKQTLRGHSRAEFLSRSSHLRNMWSATSSLSTWPQSPAKDNYGSSAKGFPYCSNLLQPNSKGVISPPSSETRSKEYYSTYHKTQNRKKFTKKEWDDFTQESTRQALAEWASSPEFTEWFVEHADRIQLLSSECSDEAVGSESDSTDENVVGAGIGLVF